MLNVFVTYVFIGISVVLLVFGSFLIIHGSLTLLKSVLGTQTKKAKKDSSKPYERAA